MDAASQPSTSTDDSREAPRARLLSFLTAHSERAIFKLAVQDDAFASGLEPIVLLNGLDAGVAADEVLATVQRAYDFYLQWQQQQQQGQASASTSDDIVGVHSASSSSGAAQRASESSSTAAATAGPAETPATMHEPSGAPYPSSFADVVALISRGEPIPGVREIPDQLAEGEPSKPVLASDESKRPRKPWEQ